MIGSNSDLHLVNILEISGYSLLVGGYIFRAAYGTESFFSLVCLIFFSESVAFHWGPKPGLIRYYFQEGNRPNTKSDILSFGIITPLENAILLRIDSHSNNDYLEFEIVSFILGFLPSKIRTRKRYCSPHLTHSRDPNHQIIW